MVSNRSRDLYKPSVIRSYETSLRLHVLPELGGGGEVDPAVRGQGTRLPSSVTELAEAGALTQTGGPREDRPR